MHGAIFYSRETFVCCQKLSLEYIPLSDICTDTNTRQYPQLFQFGKFISKFLFWEKCYGAWYIHTNIHFPYKSVGEMTTWLWKVRVFNFLQLVCVELLRYKWIHDFGKDNIGVISFSHNGTAFTSYNKQTYIRIHTLFMCDKSLFRPVGCNFASGTKLSNVGIIEAQGLTNDSGVYLVRLHNTFK